MIAKALRPARLRTRRPHLTPVDYRATTDWLLGRDFETTTEGIRFRIMVVDPERDHLRLRTEAGATIATTITGLLHALDSSLMRG